MILHCENCQTRYLLPAHALGIDGRRVRCTSCGHEWYQEPEERERLHQDIDIEPIPEAVKPLPEGSALPVPHAGAAAGKSGGGSLAGFFFAFLIFIAIAGALYLFPARVIALWPPAYGLYELAGLAPEITGEGLILDRISAVAQINEEGVKVLTVEGKIVNLREKESAIPQLQATMRESDGNIVDSWLIDPSAETIESHGEITFTTTYPAIPETVKDINIRFLLAE